MGGRGRGEGTGRTEFQMAAGRPGAGAEEGARRASLTVLWASESAHPQNFPLNAGSLVRPTQDG